ncbi:MAG: GtrA family protein, partial [Prevotella sp.]|nr:GtrA family protein [Prevotella sp.]
LGFGLNEVYIMSGHWLFIIPLTIAYLFLCTKGWTKHLLQILAGAATIFLYIYNLSLIIGYFS